MNKFKREVEAAMERILEAKKNLDDATSYYESLWANYNGHEDEGKTPQLVAASHDIAHANEYEAELEEGEEDEADEGETIEVDRRPIPRGARRILTALSEKKSTIKSLCARTRLANRTVEVYLQLLRRKRLAKNVGEQWMATSTKS